MLYCISPKYRDMWGETKRQYLTQFLSGMKKDLFITKPPEWDSDMRIMLAETIGRPAPERDSKLTTRKGVPSKSKSSQSQSTQSSSTGDIRFGVSGKRSDLEVFGGFTSAYSKYDFSQVKRVKTEKKSVVKKEEKNGATTVKKEPDY